MNNLFIYGVTATERLHTSWPWYIIRGAGFVAAGLLVLLMFSGIGMVTGLTYKMMEPVKAWLVHKTMSYALLASIAIHVLLLLIDKFRSFSVLQILVPFTSIYNNSTKLLGLPLAWFGVAAGILAMYGTIVVVVSSLDLVGWIEKRKHLWHWLHYLSYIVILFALIHGLYTGTDLKSGWLRTIWIFFTILILVGIASRIRRAGTIKKLR